MSSNVIRISFAEWLYRMTEADVPPQARALAVYAAVFDVAGNDELARLIGWVSQHGAADRTFDKYKRVLLAGGWVHVRNRAGGRGIGVEVFPALAETPVEFTDVSRRNPRKFNPRIDAETPAGITPVSMRETPAGITPVSTKTPAENTPVSADTPVKITPVSIETPVIPAGVSPRVHARIEPPSGVLFSKNNKQLQQLPPEQDAARGGGGGGYDPEFQELNGTAAQLVAFIARSANVDEATSRAMLKTNIQIFGRDAMLEAFVSAQAEMATGLVANPYKYLIGVAKKAKAERDGGGGGRAARPRRGVDQDTLKAQNEMLRRENGFDKE